MSQKMENLMYIHEIGQGFPVVFLHGSPTPPNILEPIGRALSAQRTALIVHAPGYGQSPILPGSLQGPTLTAVEAEIEQALCSRGVTKAAFVGYSLGAYHALALAVRGVVQATKVVCLAGLASLGPKDREAYLGGAQLIRSGVDLRQLLLQRMVSPGFAARHPELAQQVLSWPEATSLQNLANETEATGRCEDLLPTLSRIGAPVLARVGALDLATPKERSQEIVRAVRSGTLEVVPEVGHALTIEDLPGTIESVKRFLLSSIPE